MSWLQRQGEVAKGLGLADPLADPCVVDVFEFAAPEARVFIMAGSDLVGAGDADVNELGMRGVAAARVLARVTHFSYSCPMARKFLSFEERFAVLRHPHATKDIGAEAVLDALGYSRYLLGGAVAAPRPRDVPRKCGHVFLWFARNYCG